MVSRKSVYPGGVARVALLLSLWWPAMSSAADDRLTLAPDQIARLGIELAVPEPAQAHGSLARLPARVVLPPQHLHAVGAPVGGLVTELMVASGNTVRRGEPLMRILSASVAALRRGVSQASIQARQAERIAQRDQQLHDEGLIAEARLRSSQAAHEEARVALAERQAASRLSGAEPGTPGKRDEVVVRSPIDGVVMSVAAAPSGWVEAGSELARIGRTDALWLEVQLPLADAARIPETAWLDVDGVARRARAIGVAPEVAAGSQTATLRAQLQRIAGAPVLRPGQFVVVDIEGARGAADSGPSAWRVPNAAIVRIGDRPRVFVRTAEGFSALTVSIRSVGAAESVIEAALSADSRVVVAGASSLKAVALGIGAK